MNVLGIDTSCDDTAAAVVRDGREVLASVVASQTGLHERWGGVVPEIACRAHVESLLPVVEEALAKAGTPLAQVDAVAVTTHPGLIGALLVGVAAAKALAFALGKPLIGVDHIEAHVVANRLVAQELETPFISLIVSGGHTELFLYRGTGDKDLLGKTRDDAAGEAFDKVASLLSLAYPGGPSVERAARGGSPSAIDFPRPDLGGGSLDFSFSGLKTAVLYHLKGQDGRRDAPGAGAPLDERRIADIAASFQEAAVDQLVARVRRAVKATGIPRAAVGGGVAANGRLREKLEAAGRKHRFAVFFPPRALCTDNAAMVAALAYENLKAGRGVAEDLDVEARAR